VCDKKGRPKQLRRRRHALEAAARADKLQEDGDCQGAVTWHRILDAIDRLQAKAPAEGEKVH
jgi:hypothetical protein